MSDNQTTREPILAKMDELGSAYDALSPAEQSWPRVVALAREIDRLQRRIVNALDHLDHDDASGAVKVLRNA